MLRPDLLCAEDLPVMFGRFELRAVLGEGGMGRVFKARLGGEGSFAKDVALKVIRGQAAAADAGIGEALLREARLGAQLRHPNLVQILDAGEQDGSPWLSMELVEGGSLGDALAAGPMPVAEAFAVVRSVGAGLSWMHGFRGDGLGGIVHRDLKPANVLLHHGVPVIADYGLARAMLGEATGEWSRAVQGTPAYMSPEQARGERLDGRSDLFALGAMLFELLTGERFLPGEDFVELAMALVSVESHLPRLAALDEAAPGLAAVVRKCLRERPDDRWADVDAFLEALDGLEPRGGVLERPLWGEEPILAEPEAVVAAAGQLGDLEQLALGRLTVFAAPFTWDAAAAVLGGRWAGRAEAALRGLLERGLLEADGGRLRVAEPGAVAELLPSELAEAEAAHVRWFAGFGTDEATGRFWTREGPPLYEARLAELPDVRSAMGRADEDSKALLALSVVQPLRKRARWGEIDELIAGLTPTDAALARRVAWVRGATLRGLGRAEESRALLESVMEEAREAGDGLAEAEASRELWYLSLMGDAGVARRLTERRLMLFSRLGMRERAAGALCELAMVDRRDGLLPVAAARFEEALVVMEASGDVWSLETVLVNMWPVLVDLGRRERVREVAERALLLADELGEDWLGLHAMSHQASMLEESGRLAESAAVARRAAERFPGGDWRLAAWVHGQAGRCRALLGEVARGRAMLDEAWRALDRRGEGRLAAYLELRRVEVWRRTGEESLGALRARAEAAGVSFEEFGDARGVTEATLETARCALDGGDGDALALAEEALAGARSQSVGLTCEALLAVARARAEAGDDAGVAEATQIGARLARRGERWADVRAFEELAPEAAGVSTESG